MRPTETMTFKIAIVSVTDDLHALVIQKAMAKHDDVTCHVVEANRMCGASILGWSNVPSVTLIQQVQTRSGVALDVSELDVIWWRRVNHEQLTPPYITDPAHVDLINNDCGAALLGLLLNEFRGRWVSEIGRAHV